MIYILFFLFATNAACATTPKAHVQFSAVDTLGSPRITDSLIKTRYGSKIDALSEIPEVDYENFFRLKREIEATIKNDFGLAYAGLAIVTYFPPLSGRYLTVDVVEVGDVKERMPFLAVPTGKYQDPDGLIALWDEYQSLALDLLKSGQLQYPKSCPAWHCTLGFEHPQLSPYLPRFSSLAVKNEAALVQILRDDARANFRANAAFLLAHVKDGNKLVRSYVSSAIFDSSDLVRNNAIRVLTTIAREHTSIPIDVAVIIKALRFPTTTDRNKAGYVLTALSEKAELKPIILKGAGWVLFDMLKLNQPNNHDPAYTVLKSISGQEYGDRDYMSWKSWLESEIGPRK